MKPLVALVLTACVNQASLATSTALIACDWEQTRSMAEHGWRGWAERNPILGEEPTTTEVDLYFAAVTLANLGLYFITPKKWRWASQVPIIGLQLWTVQDNWRDGHAYCGL